MPAFCSIEREYCLELPITWVTREGMLPRHDGEWRRMHRDTPTRTFAWRARYDRDPDAPGFPPASTPAGRAGRVTFASNVIGARTLSRLLPTNSGPIPGGWEEADEPDAPDPGGGAASERSIEVASLTMTMDLSRLDPVATLRWIDGDDLQEAGHHREVTQKVSIDRTLLHSGGRRYWWTCPGYRCGRRVGVLYYPIAGHGFACRRCHGVRYASQRKKP